MTIEEINEAADLIDKRNFLMDAIDAEVLEPITSHDYSVGLHIGLYDRNRLLKNDTVSKMRTLISDQLKNDLAECEAKLISLGVSLCERFNFQNGIHEDDHVTA